MHRLNLLSLILSMVFLSTLCPYPSFGQEEGLEQGLAQLGSDNESPLGFQFGTSKKDLMKDIKAKGGKVLSNIVDSKDIRSIELEGAFVKIPFDTKGLSVKTVLELWDKKLMSSALVLKDMSDRQEGEFGAGITEILETMYEEPNSKDSFYGTESWTWLLQDVSVLLAHKRKSKKIVLEYTHMTLHKSRKDEEYEVGQKPEKPDPVKEMFLKEGPSY